MLHIQYFDVPNMSKIIYEYIKIDLTYNDFYTDQFCLMNKVDEISTEKLSFSTQNLKIKNGWFIDMNHNYLTQNSCEMNYRILTIIRNYDYHIKFDYKYVVKMNWWKCDLCFGFQSTYQNKEGKYIEFIIINNRNIQIGNKSKNGLLTFLSTKEDYIYIKANTNEKKRTSKIYNCIPLANHLAYDQLYFVFDEEIDINSGQLLLFGDTVNVPDSLRCKLTEKIIIEDATYKVNALEITSKLQKQIQ